MWTGLKERPKYRVRTRGLHTVLQKRHFVGFRDKRRRWQVLRVLSADYYWWSSSVGDKGAENPENLFIRANYGLIILITCTEHVDRNNWYDDANNAQDNPDKLKRLLELPVGQRVVRRKLWGLAGYSRV